MLALCFSTGEKDEEEQKGAAEVYVRIIKTKWPDAVQVRYFGDRIQDMLFDFCK
jgi:hypothetical protein